MARRGTQYERTIDNAELDAQAAELRAQGFTYQQIADQMHCTRSTAYERVWRAIAAVPVEAAGQLRAVEVARLNTLMAKAWDEMEAFHPYISHGKLMKGDDGQPLEDVGPKLAAMRMILSLSESLRKLLGLDAPARATVTVITEDVVDAEIARLEAELAARHDNTADRSTS